MTFYLVVHSTSPGLVSFVEYFALHLLCFLKLTTTSAGRIDDDVPDLPIHHFSASVIAGLGSGPPLVTE
jgi:hypothetical protein